MKLYDYGRITIVFQNDLELLIIPGFQDKLTVFRNNPKATSIKYAIRGEFVDDSTIEGRHQIEIGLLHEAKRISTDK